VRNADQLRQVSLHVRPGWFVAAAPCTFLGGLLLPLAWRRLLAAYGAELAPFTAIRVWCLAQTSRYIPTGLAAVASRVVLAAREGVPRSLAAGTMVVEVAVVVAWGSVATGALLPSSLLPLPARVALTAAALAGLILLPALLRLGGTIARRLPALSPDALHTGRLYESVGLYLGNAAVKSLGFVFFAAALLPVRAGDVAFLVGAVNAAAIVGMIGITPAGIGVREGVLAAILHHRYPLGDAAAVAVALRVWDLAFELTWLAIVAAARMRKGSTAPTR
jgi:uncharacterized membrane protein YbhN (UPF0104 family)